MLHLTIGMALAQLGEFGARTLVEISAREKRATFSQ
jgi:hypothetical protein